MTGVTALFVVLAVVLTVPVYAFAVRRLLGLRLSPVRAWIGGLIALACASPIITAIGSSIAKHNGSWSFLPATVGAGGQPDRVSPVLPAARGGRLSTTPG